MFDDAQVTSSEPFVPHLEPIADISWTSFDYQEHLNLSTSPFPAPHPDSFQESSERFFRDTDEHNVQSNSHAFGLQVPTPDALDVYMSGMPHGILVCLSPIKFKFGLSVAYLLT